MRFAFSLVELSIVLVILGLLTGGILAGQSLIRAAELRSITTEFQRYTTAMGSFRDKYFVLPGDFSNASGFGWGSYNGDANGFIQNTNSAASNEISTFWIHLASAGLIEGSYTSAAGPYFMVPGTTNPLSKNSSAAWNVIGLGTVNTAGVASPGAGVTAIAVTAFFAGAYGHVLTYGSSGTSSSNALLPYGVLKPEQAWNIDTKMDDGKPDTGGITTLESEGAVVSGQCSDQNTATTTLPASSYQLATTSSSACALVMKSGY